MIFAQYMESWLYGDEGYYKTYKEIGRGGDFYTAVSASPFFGASIANLLYRQIQSNQSPRDTWLIEIGAHQGHLLCDMVQWLYSCDSTLVSSMTFAIVERHPELQQVQKEYIHGRFGDEVEVKIFDDITQLQVSDAFVVSNEIFDAFPCNLYKDKQIATVEEHTIAWEDAPTNILDFASSHNLRTGEIATGYEEFAKKLSQNIGNLDFVTFDYGEQYVRNDFSIRVYREHETLPLFDEELVLSDSYQKDDITYDVNFAHAIEAFEDAGFELIDYETQARALVRFGIIEILEQFAHSTTQEKYLKYSEGIKTLIAPTVMGDRFKMMHMRKSSSKLT